MIRAPAPFPHAGSFALFADPLEPVPVINGKPGMPRLHLVRIAWLSVAVEVVDGITTRTDIAQITFPLREGVASGARTVDLAELIDCTPIDVTEAHELADLQRHLKGRARLGPKLKAQKARADALESRARMAALAAPMLINLANRQARYRRAA